MWILILTICAGSSNCTIATVPGPYSTQEICRAAGSAFEDSKSSLSAPFRSYVCIPAPDAYLFE